MTRTREKGRGFAQARGSKSVRSVAAPPGIDTARASLSNGDLSRGGKAKHGIGAMRRLGKAATERRKAGAEPDRDTWTTPSWVAEALGSFDLDPCSNERAVVLASRAFRLERGEDGLELASSVATETRVFINPPYSRGQVLRWVRAYAHTRFCFLLRFDPSTKWFAELYRSSGLVAIPRRRINFDPPPGVAAFPNIYPHALFFARVDDASEQIRRLSYAWRTRK